MLSGFRSVRVVQYVWGRVEGRRNTVLRSGHYELSFPLLNETGVGILLRTSDRYFRLS